MDLGALKIFLAVAQERSFSRAAAKVHRTQPAVSQAVRRLEVELGEQLFDRSSHPSRSKATSVPKCGPPVPPAKPV
jgi:DNA-binding transcriptional LysR family regulator